MNIINAKKISQKCSGRSILNMIYNSGQYGVKRIYLCKGKKMEFKRIDIAILWHNTMERINKILSINPLKTKKLIINKSFLKYNWKI